MKNLVKQYPIRTTLFALFILYAATLVVTEFFTSQVYIRQYVTDIEGPVFFYGVNTTLSATLLLCASLLFGVNFSIHKKFAPNAPVLKFCLWQIGIFLFLGLDERFLFHERLTTRLGNYFDIEILLYPILFALQIYLLFTYAKRYVATPKIFFNLAFAGLFFLIMFVLDVFIPLWWPMRLAAEDTTKAISCFFLLLYAWDALHLSINALPIKNEHFPSSQ